jgi:hypothetical protein
MLEQLAELARGTLRRKLPQLQQARPRQIEAHHRSVLKVVFCSSNCIYTLT